MFDLFEGLDGYVPNNNELKRLKNKVDEEATLLFEHWMMKMGMSPKRCVFGPKRQRYAKRALGWYPLDILKKAVDGCAASPWHMGKDPKTKGTEYNEFCRIIGDEERVEYFLKKCPADKIETKEKKEEAERKWRAEFHRPPWEKEGISHEEWFNRKYGALLPIKKTGEKK